jgi:hypothetical protein
MAPEGGDVAEGVVAVRGEPEVERADGLLDERRVVHHDLAGEADHGQVAAELPDGHGDGIVGLRGTAGLRIREHA